MKNEITVKYDLNKNFGSLFCWLWSYWSFITLDSLIQGIINKDNNKDKDKPEVDGEVDGVVFLMFIKVQRFDL